ncbi:MAG: ABC transporter permease subunit/CPBP intramembrane protease [Fuerstiella sp.]
MTGSDAETSRESTSRAWRLARKELREILRDRRTVITLVLMPLLVYPLLGSVMSKGVLSSLSDAQQVDVHVCLETADEAQLLASEMRRGEQLLHPESSGDPNRPAPQPTDSNSLTFPSEPGLKLTLFVLAKDKDQRTLEQSVADGFADLAVRINIPDPHLRTIGPRPQPFRDWELLTRKNSALSERGHEVVVRRLEATNSRYLDQLVQAGHIPPVRPALIRTHAFAGTSVAASPLVTFIPLVLVLMTMTGAVYPAIDLTAGERERGTLEILVAAPVSRMTLLAGKFVAVLAVALLTATMNLISMFATLFALGLEGTMLGSVGSTMIIQVLVLMVVFAAFFSAVLLSITSVARSFKEAQAYLIPLMLVSLTPGVFALLPDVRINGLMAVTPLVNTVLMGRDLLQGNVNIVMFAIVLISTALYGVLALALAARVFGSNAVLYGSAGTWSELFRRPTEPVAAASVSVAVSCLALLFSLFIVVGSLPARLPVSLQTQLLINAVVLLALFVGVPLLFAAAGKVRVQSGFALNPPPATAWLAAICLGGSLWAWLYEIQIRTLTDERIEFLTRLFEKLEVNLDAVPLAVKLLSLAVAPAMCEEFFFRGFLQNSLRRRSSASLSIFSTAILFGLFHVIVKDALLFERLLPSTLMGIVLGLVFERSRSVFPGMLLHVIHNGLLVTVSEYEDQLAAYGIGMSAHQHLPGWWLVAATVPIAIGVLLLRQGPDASAPGGSGSRTGFR